MILTLKVIGKIASIAVLQQNNNRTDSENNK